MIPTTVVDGETFVGLYAPDGSVNIVLDDETYTGVYHPSGALRVSSTEGSGIYTTDGGFYFNTLFGVGTTLPEPPEDNGEG